ncbi:hypothetical protein DSECCO2_515380 [anaerobic digester metagenome]
MGGADFDELSFEGRPFLAHFLEAGRDDDGGLALDGGQGFHGRHDRGHGHDDDGQVEAHGQVLDAFGHGQAHDFVGFGVHGDERPLEPGLLHVFDHRMADLSRRRGGADDGYGFRRE